MRLEVKRWFKERKKQFDVWFFGDPVAEERHKQAKIRAAEKDVDLLTLEMYDSTCPQWSSHETGAQGLSIGCVGDQCVHFQAGEVATFPAFGRFEFRAWAVAPRCKLWGRQ